MLERLDEGRAAVIGSSVRAEPWEEACLRWPCLEVSMVPLSLWLERMWLDMTDVCESDSVKKRRESGGVKYVCVKVVVCSRCVSGNESEG